MRPITMSLTAAPAIVALAAGSLLSPVAAGTSAGDPAARPVVHGLTTPLSLAVTDDGTVYVSQNFAGLLMRRLPGKKAQVIASVAKGGEAGAVSVRGGVVTYAVSRGHNEVGKIRRIDAQGRDRGVADLGRYERRNNPDGDVTYGFRGLSKRCAAKLPKQVGPASYTGSVETHPYATTSAPGVTYVADAGANTVLAIRGRKVSTVAVIPPAVTEITRARAKANGLPRCTVGARLPLRVRADRRGDRSRRPALRVVPARWSRGRQRRQAGGGARRRPGYRQHGPAGTGAGLRDRPGGRRRR